VKKYLVLLTLLLLLLPAHAHAHSYYTNEPAGSTTIAQCAFNDSTFCDAILSTVALNRWYNLYPSAETAFGTDAAEPGSTSGFLDFIHQYSGTCNNGGASLLPCAVGGGQVGYIDSAARREMFGGFTFYINSGYGCSLVGSSKVVLPRTLDNLQGYMQTNGVFNIRGCGATKQLVWSHNSGNNDNSHICALDLGLTCFPNVGPGTITEGAWAKIEFCIRSSSSPTARDGIVKWWVNGVLAGSYTTINYGNGNVNELVFNQTWDGGWNGQGFTQTVRQRIGDAYISAPPNGGCLAAGGGSSTPVDNPVGPPGTTTVTVTVQ